MCIDMYIYTYIYRERERTKTDAHMLLLVLSFINVTAEPSSGTSAAHKYILNDRHVQTSQESVFLQRSRLQQKQHKGPEQPPKGTKGQKVRSIASQRPNKEA